MWKSQALRVLVNERLCAAAEEIFALFERTMAEYEEETRRATDMDRSQELRLRAGDEAHTAPESPAAGLDLGPGLDLDLDPGLDLDCTDLQLKEEPEEPEEQRLKQEQDPLQEPVPESSAVFVKTEEFPLLQQTHMECKEEQSHTEHFATDLHFRPEAAPGPSDDAHSAPFRYATDAADAPTETRAGGEVFSQNPALYAHLFLQRSPEPETSEKNKFQCPVCKRTFGAKYTLQVHFRVHTGEKPFGCSICNRRFADKSNLRKHMMSHARKAQFGKKVFGYKYSMDVHMENNHASGGSACKRSFRPVAELSEHLKVHAGAKHFSSSPCDKSFFQKLHLQAHTQLHAAGKPFGIAACEGNPVRGGATDRQAKKSFSCAFCDKTFSNKYSVDVHTKNNHTGENPFSCKVCEMSFASYYALVKHRSAHTGAKPYGCPTCHKTFVQKGDLNVHMRTHTGERPFSCTMCKKAFAYRRSLNIHASVCSRALRQKRSVRAKASAGRSSEPRTDHVRAEDHVSQGP